MKQNTKVKIIGIVWCLLFGAFTSSMTNIASNKPSLSIHCDWLTVKTSRESKKAPELSGTEGKNFAGWYSDDVCTDAVGATEVVEGAYAKYVDDGLLSTKWQIGANTSSEDNQTHLRLVTAIDSLNYQNVTFQLEVDGKVRYIESKKAYDAILGNTQNGILRYQPGETFGDEAQYFVVASITNIPSSVFGTGIKVTPMWTTLDGITVVGDTQTVVIYSALEGKIAVKDMSYGTVWSAPSTVKIEENASKDACEVSGDAMLSYRAVRNEYESMQLILTANQDVDSFALYATDLKNGEETLLAEQVDIYVQKSIDYNDLYGSGSMPDALIPMQAAHEYEENSIEADLNGGLWATISVPKDILAGTYTGNFLLVVDGDDGKEVLEIPTSVEVVDYTLPDESTAKTLFSWRYARVAAGELDGSLEMMESYYKFFQDYRVSLQALPLATLSGEEMKRALLEYGDRFSTFTILSQLGDISPNVANNEALFKEQIFAVAEISKPGKNYFEKAMCYSKDEPNLTNSSTLTSLTTYYTLRATYLEECITAIANDTTGKYDECKKISGWQDSIRNIPDIIPIITGDSTQWLVDHKDEAATIAFLKSINCLCPMFSITNTSYYEEFVALCDAYDITLWWYGCSLPRIPYSTYHLADSNLLSARSVSWLQNKYDIQGQLYWDAASYTNPDLTYYQEYVNVYENYYGKTSNPYGDGNLAYPGAAYGVYGALPSMRLMSLRDGLEEYEILQDIETAYAEQASSFGVAINVDDAMETMFYKDLYLEDSHLSSDGKNGLDFTSVREKLLNTAVNLDKGLGYVMGEVTITGSYSAGYSATFQCYAQNGATLTFDSDATVTRSGQTYHVTKRVCGDTYVTITVSKSEETATYKQFIGTRVGLFTPVSPTYKAQSALTVKETTESKSTEEKTLIYNEEEGTELLLSFDSYENITGTSIRFSNLLGETKVNKDTLYITEGSGSWMIRPEGDYGDADEYPWFKMRCTDTTFGTDEFSNYNKIMLDIYNASDEAVSIQWEFTAFEAATYVLAPNAWTTCEYDLTKQTYNGDLDSVGTVKYMKITFLDKKQSRDDAVPTLYLDNLRGLVSQEGEITYSLTNAKSYITLYKQAVTAGDVMTFHLQTENAAPIAVWVQGIYKNDAGTNTATEFFVQAYTSISGGVKITATATRDCHSVRLQVETRQTAYGSATSVWTAGKITISELQLEKDIQTYTCTYARSYVTIYEQPVVEGQEITFRIRTESAVPMAIYVQGIYKNSAGNDAYSDFFVSVYNSVSGGITITATAKKDCDYIRLQLETRVSAYGSLTSSWTAGTVTVSNLEVKGGIEEVNPQTYTLTAAMNHITIYSKPVVEGQTLTFRIRTENSAAMAIYVQGIYKDSAGNDTYSDFYVNVYNSISGGITITATATKACDYVRLQLETRVSPYGAQTSSWTAGTVTISNFEITGEVEEEEIEDTKSDIAYDFEKTYSYTQNNNTITFGMPVKAGQTIKLRLQTANAVPVVVVAQGATKNSWGWTSWSQCFEKGYSSLQEGYIISIPISTDYTNLRIGLKTYDKEYGSATSSWTAGNLLLSDYEVLDCYENTYTFKDAWNKISLGVSASAGETISFDISTYNAVPMAVWVGGTYENDSGNSTTGEFVALAYNFIGDGKTIKLQTDKAYEKLYIVVQTREYAYGTETNQWTAGALTISNFQVVSE